MKRPFEIGEHEKVAILARRFTIDELQARQKMCDVQLERLDNALYHPEGEDETGPDGLDPSERRACRAYGVEPAEFLRMKAAMSGKKESK
jgi:hypothetical protein